MLTNNLRLTPELPQGALEPHTDHQKCKHHVKQVKYWTASTYENLKHAPRGFRGYLWRLLPQESLLTFKNIKTTHREREQDAHRKMIAVHRIISNSGMENI